MKYTWLDTMRKLDIDKLRLYVSEEYTYKHVLARFNIVSSRSNTMYNALRKVMQENNIDYSHFGYKKLINIRDILTIDSKYNNQTLKNRLIKEKLLDYKCPICNNKGIWKTKKLVLQLHHKNGNNRDNRLCNIELLCPNCHSQTETFSGKNQKEKFRPGFKAEGEMHLTVNQV